MILLPFYWWFYSHSTTILFSFYCGTSHLAWLYQIDSRGFSRRQRHASIDNMQQL